MISLKVRDYHQYIKSQGYDVAISTIWNRIKDKTLRKDPTSKTPRIIMCEVAQNWIPDNPGRKYKKNTTSQYIGVTFTKFNKWRSYIGNGKNRVHIGNFETEREAYEAREKYINLLIKNQTTEQSFTKKDLYYYE